MNAPVEAAMQAQYSEATVMKCKQCGKLLSTKGGRYVT